MSKLTRKLFNLFCGNKIATPTDNIGVFGSKKAGASAWSSDPDAIQSAHYLNGWNDAVVSNQAPCMDDMNALQYLFSYMIKYLYQNGIPEWLSTEEYYQYSFVRYSGSVWVSIYNGQNTDTPLDTSNKWRKIALPYVWTAGRSYNYGDIVNYNGKGYKCMVTHTASSLFETDYYWGRWNDSNPAGTLVHTISWYQGSNKPYGYFDVTGSDAGREISQTLYRNLYQVIGGGYNTCYNFSSGTQYPAVASGNFRLPDFRNCFFKNAGSNSRATGHNASHSHGHNYTSSRSLTHTHGYSSGVYFLGGVAGLDWKEVRVSSNGNSNYHTIVYQNPNWADGFRVAGNCSYTGLSIPALSISNQGSGSTPEPNYYGVKILLKY